MPELLNKSNLNLKSAKLLQDNGLFASSVHCSYYAAFQILKHVVCYTEGISYEDMESELQTENASNRKKVGVHEFLIYKKLPGLIARERMNSKIRGRIIDLKVARVRADYKNEEIVEADGTKAITQSTIISTSLNEIISK